MGPSVHSQFGPLIPGLPAGVQIVRIGLAGPNDFEYYGTKITKGPRSGSQVIVVPLPGYEFAFDITQNGYICRASGPGATTATLTFDISKPEHAEFVKSISAHPSVVPPTVSSPLPTAAEALKGSQVQIVPQPAQIEAPKPS